MVKRLLFVVPLILSPGLAVAQVIAGGNASGSGMGGGTDMAVVNRQVEAMQRDGRWQRLLAEQQANVQAFNQLMLRERQQALYGQSAGPSTRSARPRRR